MKVNPNYIYSPAIVARTKKMELFMVKLHLLGQDPIKSHSRCASPACGNRYIQYIFCTLLEKQKWECSTLLPPLMLPQVSDNPKYKNL